MKAIVVFDMPDGINLEEYKGFLTVDRFYVTDEEVGTKIDAEPMKFKWLKIKPLPEERHGNDLYGFDSDFGFGWNHCLKEITDESNSNY